MKRTLTAALFLISSILVAQPNTWVRTSGPDGGYVHNIVTRGDKILISSVYLYASPDRGTTWTSVYEGTMFMNVIDSSGYEWGTDYPSPTTKLYYKAPGHVSQLKLSRSNSIIPHISSMAVGSNGTRYVFGDATNAAVAINKGLPGDAWVKAAGVGHPAGFNWADVSPTTGTLHAMGLDSLQHYVYCRSTNEGASWTTILCPSDSADLLFAWLNVTRDGQIYTTSTHGNITRTVRSTDDGLTWTAVHAGLPQFEGLFDVCKGPGSIMYGGLYSGTAVVVSRDGGATWSLTRSEGIQGVIMGFVRYMGDSTVVVCGSRGGVFRSTDGGEHFTICSTNIPWAMVNDIARDSAGTVFAATLESGIYTTTDHGATWTRCTNGLPGGGAFGLAVSTRGTVFAGHEKQGLYRSTDHGASWSNLSTGLPTGTIWNIAALNNGRMIEWNAAGVFTSTDDGSSWTASSTSLSQQLVTTDLVVGPGDTALLLSDAGPYRTSDGGTTWKLETTGLSIPVLDHATFLGGDTVVGISGYNLLRSADAGITWQLTDTVPHSTAEIRSWSLQYLPSLGLILCRGGVDTTLWISRDGGHAWKTFIRGMEGWTQMALYKSVIADGALMGAFNGSVWRMYLVTGIAAPQQIPTQAITLAPNPVGAGNAVHLSIPDAAHATIQIIDALGRTYAAPATHNAGDWTIETAALPPGAYICKITTSAGVGEKMFVVTK